MSSSPPDDGSGRHPEPRTDQDLDFEVISVRHSRRRADRAGSRPPQADGRTPQADGADGRTRRPQRAPRRPWLYGGAGAVLAGALAVVLFAGLGTGGPTSTGTGTVRAASMEAQATQGNLEPGINPATSLLLSLTVFPRSSRPLAPNFTLTDQQGQPVSMNEFRGKVVMFSANDDQCKDLCTLLANDIVLANRDLGRAAKDVVWLSVNANPFYPQVAAVKTWTDQHGLANQANWRFGTSSPAVLSQVWKKYGILVQEHHQNRTVVHGTELFVVGPSGHEQAVTEFGAEAANTALFAHGMAQLADDFLPADQQVHVGGPETPAPTAANATVGARSPSLSLPYLEGGHGTFHLRSLRGKYVVLNFWSSTCTICRVELPHIEAAYNFAKSSVAFVGVDVSDRPGPARALAAKAHLSYPLVSDAEGSAAGAEQISGLPYTLILSPTGTILIRHPGQFTTKQLEYLLENYDSALPTSN